MRNVCIVAHINAGKTTLTERILFDSGRQRHCGDVDAGTATMDWTVEERERGISIGAGVSRVAWRGAQLQVVDTPGHVDFSGEVRRCLGVADGAVVVVDAVRGVEPQTEAVWRLLDQVGLPRLVFINKLDRPTADHALALRTLNEAFRGVRFAPLVWPWPVPGVAAGLVEAVGGSSQVWDEAVSPPPPPPPSAEQVRSWRERLDEVAADHDEEVMASFCAGEPADPRRLVGALRRGTLRRDVVPVLAGSALDNRGVEALLDAIRTFLPGPRDRVERAVDPDPAGRLAGLVFQSTAPRSDQSSSSRAGGEVLVRVFRGTLQRGDEVEIAGRQFRAEDLSEPHGNQRESMESAGPGEIVAIRTPCAIPLGATLHEPGDSTRLESPEVPAPVLSVRLEPRSSEQLSELVARAAALAELDPTLDVVFDDRLGVLTVAGLGELQLDVFTRRLGREFSGEMNVGRPAVRRYLSLAASAAGEAELERRLGGRVLRARCALRVEVLGEPGPLQVDWDHVAKPVDWPDERRRDFERGVLGSLDARLEAPPRGVRLRLEDWSLDATSVDSGAGETDPGRAGPGDSGTEHSGAGHSGAWHSGNGDSAAGVPAVAESNAEVPATDDDLLVEAAVLAVIRAFADGGGVPLEPWVELAIRSPSAATPAVVADLRARGAEMAAVEAAFAATEVRARLPLSAVIGYATRLRSMTQGRAEFQWRPVGLRSSTNDEAPGMPLPESRE